MVRFPRRAPFEHPPSRRRRSLAAPAAMAALTLTTSAWAQDQPADEKPSDDAPILEVQAGPGAKREAEKKNEVAATSTPPSRKKTSPAASSPEGNDDPGQASEEETSEEAPPEEANSVADGEDGSSVQDEDSQDEDNQAKKHEEDVVLVTGTRSAQMAGAVQVIGTEQLERTEYDDPHQVLRQVPGVYLREEDGMGLRPNIAMRGANPDRSKKVTLMEDGILFGPAPYSAPAAYYFPLMTRVNQVRVIKGPSAVSFGPQTIGGAVNLITRPIPVGTAAGADLGYGQYGYRKVHAYGGSSDEQVGFLIEGSHVGNDGFKLLPDGANTGAARNEWMVKGSYLLDPTSSVANELSVKLLYSDEASNETYLGLTNEDFDGNPNRRYPASALDRMDNHRTGITLTHELEDFERGVQLRTTVYRHDFFRIWRKFNRLGAGSASSVLNNPNDPSNAALYAVLTGEADTSGPADTIWIGPNEREFVSQGIASRFSAKLHTGSVRHRVEAGLRLHNDSIRRDHTESPFAMLGGELFPTGEGEIATKRNFGSTHALALHLTDAMTWRALTITPGVRMEGIYSQLDDFLAETRTERSVVAVLPGLGAYYALTPDWGVLAGAYRGFSPPPPGSDPSVEPEYSINYEAGTRYSSRDSKAELIGFFNDYSNLTNICTFSNGCVGANIDRQFDAGRANIYGLEALAQHDLKWGELKLPVFASYTLSFGEFRNTFQSADPTYGNVEVGDELPYLPRHQLTLQIAAEYGRFSGYAQGNYVSAVREQAGDEPLAEVLSTDPLITIGVGAAARVLTWLDVYLNARNILDYQGIMAHRPFGARPNAPVWVQGGLEAEL